MTKHIFKIAAMAIIVVAFAAGAAKAQKGYNFDQFDIGVGASANQVYGDASSVKTTLSGTINLNYNITPYAALITEFEAGTLAGGDSVKYDNRRQFKNNFIAGVFRGQVQLGEVMNYSTSKLRNALKGFYASSGIGVISNNIKYAPRYSAGDDPYYSPGKDKSTEFFVPIRVGYELKIFNAYNMPTIKFDLAYQANLMLSENIDGYSSGNYADLWSQLTLGVKFSLGSPTSYRKSVSYYYQ